MLKLNPTTPITVWAEFPTYISGPGASSTWLQVKSGNIDTYFCEWRGTYGDRLLTAQSLGVSDLITVRMTYNPDVLQSLATKRCVIIKNADAGAIKNGKPDKENPNVYQLYSGVDNVAEENQYMEFQARRYQGK